MFGFDAPGGELVKTFLRRRLSWFHTTWTPQEQALNPWLSLRTVMVAAWLPAGIGFAFHTGHPVWGIWPAFLLVFCLVDDISSGQYLRLGLRMGRTEFLCEMLDAWDKYDMTPVDYISRELMIFDGDTEAARRTVRRSHRRRVR